MTILVSTKTVVVEQPKRTEKRYARYVFFILFVATLLNGMDSSEFLGASTVIARELHLGINDIGILASAFTIFLTISILPVGIWADHTKRSYIIAVCLGIWSLATALTGIAGGFIVLFVTRMFTGIGEAGYAPAGNSLAGDFFKGDKRAKVISWLALAGLVGPIAGLVLGGVIAGLSAGSWRMAFLVTGIPGLILAFFAWRMREPARSQKKPINVRGEAAYGAVKPTDAIAQLKTLLRIKTLICLIIIGVFTTYTATALQTYFPTLLQQRDTFGLTSGQAAIFSGLVLGPTAFLGVILGGYLADWLNRRYRGARLLVCVLSVLITAPLNIASLLIMNTHNVPLFCAVMIPSFFINTLHIGPLLTAVLDVVPAKQSASAIAIFVFAERIFGTALAPLLIGFLARNVDPTGLHFQHSVAGHDLIFALLITCAPAFIISGLVGILGLRWVSQDRDAAEKLAVV